MDDFKLGYKKDRHKKKSGRYRLKSFRGGHKLIKEAPVKVYYVDPKELR